MKVNTYISNANEVTIEIPIEKDVALSVVHKHRGWAKLLHGMAIGDSFLLMPDDNLTHRRIMDIKSALFRQAKRDGTKITTRTIGDGMRVWRVK